MFCEHACTNPKPVPDDLVLSIDTLENIHTHTAAGAPTQVWVWVPVGPPCMTIILAGQDGLPQMLTLSSWLMHRSAWSDAEGFSCRLSQPQDTSHEAC